MTYPCHRCQNITRSEFDSSTEKIACIHCDHEVELPENVLRDDKLQRCLVCPSEELYVRKDFPQQLGVTIVVIGLVTSCIPWYNHDWYGTFAVLFVTALIDAALYAVKGNLLQCYRCHAQYRGIEGIDEQKPFDLEVHERHRQQVARLKQAEQAARNQEASAGQQPTDEIVERT